MRRRWPSIPVTVPCSLRAVAVAVCLALSLEGCANFIAEKERFDPNPDVDLKEGAARADVERMLGEPIVIETLPDGNVRAVYEYTTREGKSAPWWTRPAALGCSFMAVGGCGAAPTWVILDAMTLGVAEFVFMAWWYFAKDKHTYQTEIVYSPAGTIVERFPARDKSSFIWRRAAPITQGPWEAYVTEANRVLPGKHATQEWRTFVHQCVDGKTTETRKDGEGVGP